MSDEDEGSRGEGRRESGLIASALDPQPLCGETFRLTMEAMNPTSQDSLLLVRGLQSDNHGKPICPDQVTRCHDATNGMG